MKTQRTLAALWLAVFIAGPSVWLWMFLNNSTPGYNGIHAVHSVVCLFGAVACVFLFRGAKWARIAIGIIAIYFALGTFFGEIVPYGWMRVDKLGDDALFVFSLVTIVLLFFRRYQPVQNPPVERTAAAVYFTGGGACAVAQRPRGTPADNFPSEDHMKLAISLLILFLVLVTSTVASAAPKPLDMDAASAEVAASYGKAHPEVQEFVLHTARTFGRDGMWLNEKAYADLKPEERDARVAYLAKLFADAEYGRHLCSALAEASALKDPKLVPGLMKVAAYHVDGKDYDCRPKWMAVAALARQESPDAVPLLVSLVDHGNQNTRLWARAALSRMAKDDFKADKQAWNKWWVGQGHGAIDAALLKPYTPPPAEK